MYPQAEERLIPAPVTENIEINIHNLMSATYIV